MTIPITLGTVNFGFLSPKPLKWGVTWYVYILCSFLCFIHNLRSNAIISKLILPFTLVTIVFGFPVSRSFKLGATWYVYLDFVISSESWPKIFIIRRVKTEKLFFSRGALKILKVNTLKIHRKKCHAFVRSVPFWSKIDPKPPDYY